MNSLILEKVDDLVNYIKDSKSYQDYIFLSEKLIKNEKVIHYINDIKKIQKEIVKKQIHQEDITSLEEKIDFLLNDLNKIPLYIDFMDKQRELNEIYQNIKERLDNYFYNLLN